MSRNAVNNVVLRHKPIKAVEKSSEEKRTESVDSEEKTAHTPTEEEKEIDAFNINL